MKIYVLFSVSLLMPRFSSALCLHLFEKKSSPDEFLDIGHLLCTDDAVGETSAPVQPAKAVR